MFLFSPVSYRIPFIFKCCLLPQRYCYEMSASQQCDISRCKFQKLQQNIISAAQISYIIDVLMRPQQSTCTAGFSERILYWIPPSGEWAEREECSLVIGLIWWSSLKGATVNVCVDFNHHMWSPAETPDYAPEPMPLKRQNECSPRQRSALPIVWIVCLLVFFSNMENYGWSHTAHMLEINPRIVPFTLLLYVVLRENGRRCSFNGFLPASSWISSNHTAGEVSTEPQEKKIHL